MAQSRLPTQQYPSQSFVESCGAILFDLSDPSAKRVCLGNIISKNEYTLPKGRRNINESRKDAALREVYEETGYRCKLLPVTMATRATAPDDDADVADESRIRDGLTEPFMCTVRELSVQTGVKVIWWYVAVLDRDGGERGQGEEKYKPEFFECGEAVGKLWFETDREILRRAVEIVEETTTRQVGGADGA
ncbi:hypothetical protein CC86DRAFT_364867 [Ophiobolus disseminans]|uniref:Nudix hydrolase domain-containing protein n=1 Tax=Ophiobolus disseminans TaxID=1469910 RepID=A0A6A7AHS2_9PLEO|nr:hypothetical protein CC86DRAFT_364867 [Ophiobolus disseminans]